MKALSTFSVQRNEAQMDVICHEFERLRSPLEANRPACCCYLLFFCNVYMVRSQVNLLERQTG